MKKTLYAKLSLVSAALVGSSAFAVVDTTVAEAGIEAATVAILSVLAAMVVMSAAVYGVKKVLKLFGRP